MLDNEPTGGDRDGATPPPGETAESTTPTRRPRATRRKAAPPAAAVDAPGAEPGAAIEAANAVDAAAPAADDQAAAVRTAPARRRRKAAAPDAVDAPETEPVKAARSRRKKAAGPAAEAADVPPAEAGPAAVGAPIIAAVPLDGELVEEEPAAAGGHRAAAQPPAVLFMAADIEAEPAPRSRRGRGTAPNAEVEAEPAPSARHGRRAASSTEVEAEPAPSGRRGRRAASGTPAAAPAADAATAGSEPVAEEQADGARRGRRRRRGAADEAVEAVETPAGAEPAVDEPDESADDVADTADDEFDDESPGGRRRRRRGRRGRGRGKGPADDDEAESDAAEATGETEPEDDEEADEGDGVTRRRRRRRRKGAGDADTGGIEDGVHTVVRVREPRRTADEVQGVSGSTRLEAKRQRRRDGREQRRTRPPILSESEFLARREAVDRVMVVRQKPDRTQIAVLEDGILVEHYVARATSGTVVGNVYLGKVQNVLPSMEAAFVDVGRGRNAVLYAGEVNWDATGLEGRARSIEQALRSGDSVLVQVTKDPIGHKGARLSSHIALSGRHLVYVPNGNASGISRKLPDTERKRLRDVLKKLVPDGAGVIVRTAAEGASEDELARDVKRLQAQWEEIQRKAAEGHAPTALSEEPDLVIRVVRDLFNEDFRELIVQGDQAYAEVENYLNSVSPDLVARLRRYAGASDVFAEKRIDEQILKGLDRKVFLPSGGHLVVDRTEAMTVIDVNTGKYTGAGGNLEETVTRNNLEAAEEIVRQLRLRDLGGIVVIDFIDMVLESNRELVLRRLTECLGRDRTKHQVTEITSLGLVQMTRKRIGSGLLEAFSETCDHCKGRGVIIHTEPVPEKRTNGGGGGGGAGNQVKAVAAATRTEQPPAPAQQQQPAASTRSRRRRGGAEAAPATPVTDGEDPMAVAAGLPPIVGSGIVAPAGSALTSADPEDDYDISGYDLSRYEASQAEPVELGEPVEPLRLTGADDPDAIDEEEEDDDEPVGAGAGRRRTRRGGTRRRTRP
jgi:ribonuclease E